MMMAVTADQVATLRAHLAGDFDEYNRLWASLDRKAADTGYTALIAAAFFEAVDRRFAKSGAGADVIEFVGSVRARFDEGGDEIDPLAAETLIRAALGDDSGTELDDDTVISTQITVLTALILDENLDNVDLDEFMEEARKLADEWTS
jgi:pantoate kinase